MAANTRLVLETEVKLALGNRTDVDADLTRWVKRAYQHLTQTVEFPEAEVVANQTLTIGTRAYPVPSDFFSIYSARNQTTQKRLLQVGPADYAELNTATTATPDRYAVFNQQYNFHPTPDATDVIQIRYRKQFAELALSSSVHLLPELWEQPIVNFAIAFGCEALNEIERARFYRGAAINFIREQSPRIAWNLYDRSEAPAVLGGEPE